MAGVTKGSGTGGGVPWRGIGWGGAAGALLLPLVTGAPWTLSDYVAAGVVLGGAGVALELVARASGSPAYRGAALAVLASVLLLWANGAVGLLGDEGNPANWMFPGVVALALAGSVLAGFRAAGMARAMVVAAGAQVLAGVIGLGAGLGSPGWAGVAEVALATVVFGGLWLMAGALFRRAVGERAGAAR